MCIQSFLEAKHHAYGLAGEICTQAGEVEAQTLVGSQVFPDNQAWYGSTYFERIGCSASGNLVTEIRFTVPEPRQHQRLEQMHEIADWDLHLQGVYIQPFPTKPAIVRDLAFYLLMMGYRYDRLTQLLPFMQEFLSSGNKGVHHLCFDGYSYKPIEENPGYWLRTSPARVALVNGDILTQGSVDEGMILNANAVEVELDQALEHTKQALNKFMTLLDS